MSEHDTATERAVSLLVHASRVSPPLREAVAVVEQRIQALTADNERLRAQVARLTRTAAMGPATERQLSWENERLREVLHVIDDAWCDGCSPIAGSALAEAPEDWQPLAIRRGDRITIDGETHVVTAINPTGPGLSVDLDAEDRQ